MITVIPQHGLTLHHALKSQPMPPYPVVVAHVDLSRQHGYYEGAVKQASELEMMTQAVHAVAELAARREEMGSKQGRGWRHGA